MRGGVLSFMRTTGVFLVLSSDVFQVYLVDQFVGSGQLILNTADNKISIVSQLEPKHFLDIFPIFLFGIHGIF